MLCALQANRVQTILYETSLGDVSCCIVTITNIDWAGIAVAREHQTLGVRTWSNIKSWQHRPSRSHVYGSVGGSNRCCLTMASKLFHRKFHGNRHQTNTHNSKHHRSRDRAPLSADVRACKHSSTLAWEPASVRNEYVRP